MGGLRWVLAMDRRLPERLSLGCVQTFGLAWRESGQSKAREPLYGTPSGYERATGTWTPAAKTGSVAATSEAILFDSLAPKGTRGRPFKLARMGLQFSRGRLYLTGEIRRAKSLAAAVRPRRRLALIARPKLLAGPQRAWRSASASGLVILASPWTAKRKVSGTGLPRSRWVPASSLGRAMTASRCRGRVAAASDFARRISPVR